MSQGATTAPEIEAALERVLAREDFRPDPFSDWLQSTWKEIGEWFAELFGMEAETVAAWSEIFLWVLVGTLVGFLLFVLFRGLARRVREVEPTRPLSGKELVKRRVSELMQRARQAESAGDRLLALRLYFFALVVGLGERGQLEYRDAWTNRELLDRGKPSAKLRERLLPIVSDLDRKSFGELEVGSEDVRRMEGLCVQWLP